MIEDLLVYAALAKANKAAREIADLPSDGEVVVAAFDWLPDLEAWRCLSHTAQQIRKLLTAGKTVIAHMRDGSNNRCWNMFMGFADSMLCIFDSAMQDAGFSHRFGEDEFFLDGDVYNETIGNELWIEF